MRSLDPEKEGLSRELQRALEPLLSAIAELSQRICQYNERIEALAQQSYPQVMLLKQVNNIFCQVNNRAIQACAFHSPFSRVLSDIEIYRQLWPQFVG